MARRWKALVCICVQRFTSGDANARPRMTGCWFDRWAILIKRIYEVDPDFLEHARHEVLDQPELPWDD